MESLCRFPVHVQNGFLILSDCGDSFEESWTETAVTIYGNDSQAGIVIRGDIFQMVCPCERDVIFRVDRDLHIEDLWKRALRHMQV